MRISDWSSYVCSSDLAVSAFAVVLILFGIDTDEQRFRELVGFAEDHIFDALGRVRIVAKEFFRVLLALTDADAVERRPSTRFLDDAGLDAEVDDLAETRTAFAVHYIEFDLFDRT